MPDASGPAWGGYPMVSCRLFGAGSLHENEDADDYNRNGRHSKTAYITPIEHELRSDKTPIPAGGTHQHG
jgi:hypothetical protein